MQRKALLTIIYFVIERQLTAINLHLEISEFKNLQMITQDTFSLISRILVSLRVTDCPLLHTIEPSKDFPAPGLSKLTSVKFMNLNSLAETNFLNSQFRSRNGNRTIEVWLEANDDMKSLGLRRPLDLSAGEKMDLVLLDNPKLDSGFDLCFWKGYLR